jgi:hypothetical protein
MFLNSEPVAYGEPGEFMTYIDQILTMSAIAHLVKLVHVFAGIYVYCHHNFYLWQSESPSLPTDGNTSPILTLSGRYTQANDIGDGRLSSISQQGYWPLRLSSPC